MMDPSANNSFEEQWRKAFQESSETPPLSAWEGIEARLEKEERKVVPLWWRSPRYWYGAASVAALLLVGIALWNAPISSEDKTDTPLAQKYNGKEKEGSREGQQASSESNTSEKLQEKAEVSADETSGEQLAVTPQSVYEAKTKTFPEGARVAVKTNSEIISSHQGKADHLGQVILAGDFDKKAAATPVSERYMTANRSISGGATNEIIVGALDPIAYKDLDVYVQKRYVFFRPNTFSESVEPKVKKDKDYYAGISMMPASFNPNVKLTSAPSAFATANATRQSLSGNSNPGASYAIQTQGGKRISKHWSVETGINYLQGNSSYEGSGYLLDVATSKSQNVLQSAYADKSALGTPLSNSASPLYVDLKKEVRNDYRFLQVPVQAGYTLNPDKKMSYSVLGGVMANYFLSNAVESASGEVITTTGSDDVYRTMNVAASTGVRLNYRISPRWKATLSGTYQQSLNSGFKNNETLESHPSLYGVAWGMRFAF